MNASNQERDGRRGRGLPLLTDLIDRLRLVVGFETAALVRLRIPRAVVYAVYAALAIAGAVWPFIRAVPVGPSLANQWDPFYTYLFIESLPFLAVAMAAGLLGRSFALVFVLPFVVADWLVFQFGGTIHGYAVYYSAGANAGRLVLLVLLGVLVFMFPALPRTAVGLGRRRGALWAAAGAVIGGVAYAALVLAWAVAVPYLVRPIFNNDFVPTHAIGDLQEYRDVIAFIGAGLAMVAGLVLYPRTSPILDGIALAPWGSWTRRLAPLAPVIVPAVLLVMFIGLVTTWLDAAVLIAGGAAGPLLAPVVRRAPPFRWLLEHVWLPLRLLLGVGVATAIAVALTVVHYGPALGSEFFIMVLTVAISVPLVIWLGGPNGRPAQTATASQMPGTAGVVSSAVALAALLTVAGLVLAGPVLADNCSGFLDCAYGKLSEWAAAALAFLAAALAALWTGLKTAVLHPLIPEGLASEEATEAIRGGISYYQEYVVKNMAVNDYEESDRIRNLSTQEFLQEAATGKWDGIGGSYGGGGGGMSIGGSAGCLPVGTMIDTPSGARAVEDLRAGDAVVTTDAGGARAIAPLLAVTSQSVPPWHVLVQLDLADGRMVRASAGHPLADGRLLAELTVGGVLDGALVVAAETVGYDGGVTFDLLPDGPTGVYFVGGVPLGSTIQPPTTVTSRGKAVSRSRRSAAASSHSVSSMRTPSSPSR